MDPCDVGLTQLDDFEQVEEERDAVVGFRYELLEEAVVRQVQVHLELAQQLRDRSELLQSHLSVRPHASFL